MLFTLHQRKTTRSSLSNKVAPEPPPRVPFREHPIPRQLVDLVDGFREMLLPTSELYQKVPSSLPYFPAKD